MRRNTLAVLLCGAGVVLWSCGSDADPPTFPDRPRMVLSIDGPACGPPTHPSGESIENVTTRPAWGIAVRDDGLVYFTQPWDGGVGITTTQSRVVEGFIPTGSIPSGLDFSPDGATAYVTNQLSQNVGVINVATAQQVATISTLGKDPFVVRVSPDGTRLFFSTNTTTVYIVDTETLQIIGSVEVGFAPNAFAVHPDGRIMYVSAFLGGTVTEMDNVLFSALTMNTQPLHVNEDFASKTEFRQRLVNGVFTLGLVVGLTVPELTEGTIVANLGYDKVIHPNPVFHGEGFSANFPQRYCGEDDVITPISPEDEQTRRHARPLGRNRVSGNSHSTGSERRAEHDGDLAVGGSG